MDMTRGSVSGRESGLRRPGRVRTAGGAVSRSRSGVVVFDPLALDHVAVQRRTDRSGAGAAVERGAVVGQRFELACAQVTGRSGRAAPTLTSGTEVATSGRFVLMASSSRETRRRVAAPRWRIFRRGRRAHVLEAIVTGWRSGPGGVQVSARTRAAPGRTRGGRGERGGGDDGGFGEVHGAGNSPFRVGRRLGCSRLGTGRSAGVSTLRTRGSLRGCAGCSSPSTACLQGRGQVSARSRRPCRAL